MARGLFVALFSAAAALVVTAHGPSVHAASNPVPLLTAFNNAIDNGTGNATMPSRPSSNKSNKSSINHIITEFEQAIAPYQHIEPKKVPHPNQDNDSAPAPTSPDDIALALQQTLSAYQTATQSDGAAQTQLQTAVNAYIAALQEAVSESQTDLLTAQEPQSTNVISYLEDALVNQYAVDATLKVFERLHLTKTLQLCFLY
ncbi:hypothetical protein GCM10025858_11060 [Alicyclobacillus sacchari]|uniref:hypothetical protein n=1 Tax=Alicyclobacillus sacchari TaxID=392010 RepID=UPI0023EA3F9F|nr:hypothetical protein [Alicyclobacillus sacchari]GMA56603.1 hypothetical protein GCM10025858_11060 [Alicyclobacillus sacchari]